MKADQPAASSTRTATILFTDLVDSTAQRVRLGDDRADALRREHDEIAAAVVADGAGEVIKSTGDGVMLVFDSASGAVGAALALQRAIATRNLGAPDPIGLRVGLGAGDVSVEGGDLFGMPVVEAARLCDKADAGQILVSELVRLLCGSRGEYDFVPVGNVELKGIDGPVAVHSVAWNVEESLVWTLPAALRPPSDGLVGRAAEMAVLSDLWGQVRSGGRAAVSVCGEPGIGKTRLAATLAAQTSADGALVLYGRCEDGMAVPYQPIAEAVRRFVTDHPDSEGAQLVAARGAEFALLSPGRTEAVLRADAEESRWQLFEAVRELLEVLAAAQPVLVVVDDLHWASESTISLLRHLLGSVERGRVLTLLQYRDTEDAVILADLLADLSRLDARRLALAGLSEAEVEELAGADRQDGAAVHAATNGNPFFVRELAKATAESSTTTLGIHDVVMSRVQRLGGQTVDALTIAALVGPRFELTLLERIQGTDLLDAIESAEAAGLVAGLDGSPGQFRFEHDLVRHTLHDSLSAARRARMHTEIANALDALGQPFHSPARLAEQLLAAAAPGQAGRTVEVVVDAVRDLHLQLANDEAVALGESALRYAERDGTASPAVLAELLLGLAYCGHAENRLVAARESAMQAIAAAMDADRTDLAAHAAMVALAEGVVADPVPELERWCEELLAQELDDVWQARVLGAFARHQASIGEGVAASGMARQALDLATALDDPIGIFLASGAIIFADLALGNVAELLELSERIRDTLTRVAALRSTGTGALSLEYELLFLDLGDGVLRAHLAAVAGDLGPARAIAARVETRPMIGHRRFNFAQAEGFLALIDGRWDAVSASAALMLAEAGSLRNLELSASSQFLAAASGTGAMLPLVDVLEPMVAEHPTLVGFRGAWSLALARGGDTVAAAEVFRPLREGDFASIRQDYLQPGTLAIIAEACTRIADRDSAPALLRLLGHHQGNLLILGTLVWAHGAADRYRAMLLALVGDDRFDDAYAAALALEQRIESPPLCAETRAWWARDLLRRGRGDDHDRAAVLAAEARDVAEDLGMAGLLDDLHQWGLGPAGGQREPG